MRNFILGSLVAIFCASAGCESTEAAPKASPTAGAATKAGDPWASPTTGAGAKAAKASDPWAAKPPAKTGATNGSATTAKPSADASASASPAKDDGEGTGQSAKKSSASGEGTWSCTGSSSVRVCGFAGACNYQMVFGNGFGKDRFLASQQAKRSCEASARAKGATAICVVQCSVR